MPKFLDKIKSYGQKIKNYAKENPWKALGIGIAITIGIAAIAVGIAFSGGLLAVPVAAGVGLGTLFGGISAGAAIGATGVIAGTAVTAGALYHLNKESTFHDQKVQRDKQIKANASYLKNSPPPSSSSHSP